MSNIRLDDPEVKIDLPEPDPESVGVIAGPSPDPRVGMGVVVGDEPDPEYTLVSLKREVFRWKPLYVTVLVNNEASLRIAEWLQRMRFGNVRIVAEQPNALLEWLEGGHDNPRYAAVVGRAHNLHWMDSDDPARAGARVGRGVFNLVVGGGGEAVAEAVASYKGGQPILTLEDEPLEVVPPPEEMIDAARTERARRGAAEHLARAFGG